MSIEWIVDKGEPGRPDHCVPRTNIQAVGLSPYPIADLKKDDVIIAVYLGFDYIKDEDIIEHAKTYCKEHGKLKLFMQNSDKCYTILDNEGTNEKADSGTPNRS